MNERPTFSEAMAELTDAVKAAYEPGLLRLLHWMDARLRRWPWLNRRLGGEV